jgi:hypothetical protein
MKINTKNGNQTLTNVPLAKKNLNRKTKKKITFCRGPGMCREWAVGTDVCSADGPSWISAKASQPG